MSGRPISDYLSERSYSAVCHVLHIFLTANHPRMLLQQDRLTEFARHGLNGPEHIQCAKLGFFPLPSPDGGAIGYSTAMVACFSCGFECKLSSVKHRILGSFNRLHCPLQAARCPKQQPMRQELLGVGPSDFPSPMQLAQLLTFIQSNCGTVLTEMFPPDAVLLCAATMLVTERRSLLSLQPGYLVERLQASDWNRQSLWQFPVLDEASTFTGDFINLISAGPGAVDPRDVQGIGYLISEAVMAS
ncbi:hypothetical protein BOX15_Mlig015637g1 [Macrostomum lignano]|uniref:Uncharacterized protein n=1 Tax=Macrostomum lignano TaxID=282301 RepID=A0A267GQ13_9PLAT|nr:hypothetical protein BOX15_Mlig015637g1 [Macrostomum lignano]